MSEIAEFFSVCWIQTIIAIVAAYLISSVNTSIIVTRIVLHEDIRTLGSGNAGFTNVLRCVGKTPAIITFVGDFLKGVVSVLIAFLLITFTVKENMELYRAYLMYLSGLFAVVGHTFPVYYKFKGGKGVVTTAAVMLMLDWRILLIGIAVFGIMFISTRIISACAILNSAVYPLSTLGVKLLDFYGFTTVLSPFKELTPAFIVFAVAAALINSALVIIRHKDNIKRLIRGEEKKATIKK